MSKSIPQLQLEHAMYMVAKFEFTLFNLNEIVASCNLTDSQYLALSNAIAVCEISKDDWQADVKRYSQPELF